MPRCCCCSSSRWRCMACWWGWACCSSAPRGRARQRLSRPAGRSAGWPVRGRRWGWWGGGGGTGGFVEAGWEFGGMAVSGQSLVVLGVTLALLGLLLILGRSMVGKALRATAINRVGARLMGIPTERSAELSFALAALIGAVSGLLIAPLTTVYYDTGFLIGLK